MTLLVLDDFSCRFLAECLVWSYVVVISEVGETPFRAGLSTSKRVKALDSNGYTLEAT